MSQDRTLDDPLGSMSIAIFFRDTLELDAEPRVQRARDDTLPKFNRKLSNRYAMVSEIGRGGFATVYLVEDHSLERTVALKLLRLAGKGRPRIERFLEEARATARLEHPNIVPVYDIGTLGGIPFYTMKYVRGRTLASVLRGLRQGDAELTREYGLARLIQVLLQVAMAAQYAHEKGFVHRDLKPGNVMLGEFGEVYVMDWGLAHAMLAARGGRALLGTPVYMAPEQAMGRLDQVDGRTDVHALGVMLYEVLTLRRPFEGSELKKLLKDIAIQVPPPPSSVATGREVPPALEAAALRALAKVKEIRQPAPRRFHDDLLGWLEAEGDRSRRRGLALERTAQARARLERYRALRAWVKTLTGQVEELQQRFVGPESVAQKLELVQAWNQLRARRRELVRVSSSVVASLTEVLGLEPNHQEARAMLAEYYWSRLEESREEGNLEAWEFFAELVSKYDRGEELKRLRSATSLWLETSPAGVEATLHRFVEEGFGLLPVLSESLGPTPVRDHRLAVGSYLVVLKGAQREVRYPVLFEPGTVWKGTVRVDVEPPAGFVWVPAGPFRRGPRRGSVGLCEDYAIARFPVRFVDYLEFLDDLAALSLETAEERAPRLPEDGCTFLERQAGRLVMRKLSPFGGEWSEQWPVFGVSWHDARAYAAWLSERHGRVYDLPTSLEWEKAARGVDGRSYPWGDRFDPVMANMKRSLWPPPRPVEADGFPGDESPYGVRGLGGNVRDWCLDPAEEGDETRDERVVKGGAWSLGASCAETWCEGALAACSTSQQVGFRLVWRPPA